LLLTVAGIILIAGAGFALHAIKQRGFLLAADRA